MALVDTGHAIRAERTAAEQMFTAVTVTIGVALWDSGGSDELVSRADAALYTGKAAGRDNVQVAPAATPELSQELSRM